LRLDDIEAMELDSEATSNPGDPDKIRERLRINGATEAEIEFLLNDERVELNAMPSDVFIQFVERKLNEHGVAKVIPSADMLTEAFTTFKRGRAAYEALRAELERLNKEPVNVPADLADLVKARLVANPAATWDRAVKAILYEGNDIEEKDDDATDL
jgi:hypothetical protein